MFEKLLCSKMSKHKCITCVCDIVLQCHVLCGTIIENNVYTAEITMTAMPEQSNIVLHSLAYSTKGFS